MNLAEKDSENRLSVVDVMKFFVFHGIFIVL